MRTCGSCRLCCWVFPVPALEKPAGEWCRFICESGCAIHNEGRPPVCREYECYWIEHDEMPDQYRPDRVGVVVTENGTITVGDEIVPVLLVNESIADAAQFASAAAQPLTARLVAEGFVLLLVSGTEMRIEFDATWYPRLSASEIEVAYRYAQSQDAEELKRLGAVTDDFRPLGWDEANQLFGDERPKSDGPGYCGDQSGLG